MDGGDAAHASHSQIGQAPPTQGGPLPLAAQLIRFDSNRFAYVSVPVVGCSLPPWAVILGVAAAVVGRLVNVNPVRARHPSW